MSGNKSTVAFLVAMACLCANASAQSKLPGRADYSQARKLYNELGAPLSRSLLWEKTTLQQRKDALKTATDLRDKTQKLWGEFQACTHAANSNLHFVMALNTIAHHSQTQSPLSPYDMLGALRTAEEFGNHRAACYDYVEALDAPARK